MMFYENSGEVFEIIFKVKFYYNLLKFNIRITFLNIISKQIKTIKFKIILHFLIYLEKL